MVFVWRLLQPSVWHNMVDEYARVGHEWLYVYVNCRSLQKCIDGVLTNSIGLTVHDTPSWGLARYDIRLCTSPTHGYPDLCQNTNCWLAWSQYSSHTLIFTYDDVLINRRTDSMSSLGSNSPPAGHHRDECPMNKVKGQNMFFLLNIKLKPRGVYRRRMLCKNPGYSDKSEHSPWERLLQVPQRWIWTDTFPAG